MAVLTDPRLRTENFSPKYMEMLTPQEWAAAWNWAMEMIRGGNLLDEPVPVGLPKPLRLQPFHPVSPPHRRKRHKV